MTVDRKLLEILVCPISKQSVFILDQNRLQRVNDEIERGNVNHLDGSLVESPLVEALVTANKNTIYRVQDNIPVMLEEQSIPCEQLQNWS